MPELTDRSWLWLAAALYVGGFLLGTFSLVRHRRHSRGLMYFIIAAGFALQTFALYLRGMKVHGCPIGNPFELLQFTAWSATSLYLLIGATFRLSLLGYFTSALAAGLTVLSLSIPPWDVGRSAALKGNPWIEFHASLALFSYGVFGLLALTSLMYLLQHYSLQKRSVQGLFSFLPSIVELDQISVRLLSAGVLLITSALAVGSVYWLRDTSSVNGGKLTITVAVWLAYGLALALRWRSILITKRLAWTCILLFMGALLSLGPVNSSRKPVETKAAVRQTS